MDQDLGVGEHVAVDSVIVMIVGKNNGIHVLGEHTYLLEGDLQSGPHLIAAGIDDDQSVIGPDQCGCGMGLEYVSVIVTDEISDCEDVQVVHDNLYAQHTLYSIGKERNRRSKWMTI